MGKTNKKQRARALDQQLESVIAQQAFEDAQGGSLASKPDTDIFVVDKKTDVKTYKSVRDGEAKSSSREFLTEDDDALDGRSKLKQYQNKVLYWQKVLEPTGGLPALVSQKKKIPENRKTPFERAVEKLSKKKVVIKKPAKKNKNGQAKDVWEEVKPNKAIASIKPVVAPEPPKRKIRGKRALPEVSKRVPAVVVAKPGMSYNPTYEAHQDLLGLAVAKELHQQQLVRQQQSVLVPEPNADEIQGLFVNIGEEVDADAPVPVSAPRLKMLRERRRRDGVRITTTQRNKQRRARMLMKRAQFGKLMRKRMRQIGNLENVILDIKRDEHRVERRKRASDVRRRARLLRPPFRGKYKFEGDNHIVDVPLSEDLSANLRTVKPQGSLLKDQLISFHRRALIPPNAKDTKPRMSRKMPLKVYTKFGIPSESVNIHDGQKKGAKRRGRK